MIRSVNARAPRQSAGNSSPVRCTSQMSHPNFPSRLISRKIGAANIQIATCSPNFLILESIQDWGGFHAKILKKPIRFEAGFVIPPSEPGLGVELDEAVALAHPYKDQALHLEPAEQPMDFD